LIDCASLTFNSKLVFIRSDQIDAEIFVNGKKVGVDSAVIWGSPNKGSLQVEARKEGFEPAKAEIKICLNWITLGNFAYLGASVIGFAIDYFSDSMFYYTESSKVLKLKPKNTFTKQKDEFLLDDITKFAFDSEAKVQVFNMENVIFSESLFLDEVNLSKKTELYPGYYKVNGKVVYEIVRRRKVRGRYQYSYTTYKAPDQVEKVIRIQPNGITIICGEFDKQNKTSSLSAFHVPYEIVKEHNEESWYSPKNPHKASYASNACSHSGAEDLRDKEYLFDRYK